jgi:hypothetical protein
MATQRLPEMFGGLTVDPPKSLDGNLHQIWVGLTWIFWRNPDKNARLGLEELNSSRLMLEHLLCIA